MFILALDCATQACSVAAMADGRVTAHCYEEMARGHAERLLPMAGEVLAAAGADFAAVDAFAVTVGPGTYTGVRIGLATARGLALAAARPIVGVTTLEAVARAALLSPALPRTDPQILAVALETKRADFYLQCFKSDLTPLTPPASTPADDVAGALPPGPLVIAGDGAPRLAGLLAADRPVILLPDADFPDARHVAAAASRRIAADPRTLCPPSGTVPAPGALYLRPPDVTLPRSRPTRAPAP